MILMLPEIFHDTNRVLGEGRAFAVISIIHTSNALPGNAWCETKSGALRCKVSG